MDKNIPVVILCGGLGTRLREETEFKPKPMVEIGGKPILWHIMKHYAPCFTMCLCAFEPLPLALISGLIY